MKRTTTTPEVDQNAVASRAYMLFLERGGGHGHDVEDWLQAEREVREELGQPTPAKSRARSKKN